MSLADEGGTLIQFKPCADGRPIHCRGERVTPGRAAIMAMALVELAEELEAAVTQALVVAYIAENGPTSIEDVARALDDVRVRERLLQGFEAVASVTP